VYIGVLDSKQIFDFKFIIKNPYIIIIEHNLIL